MFTIAALLICIACAPAPAATPAAAAPPALARAIPAETDPAAGLAGDLDDARSRVTAPPAAMNSFVGSWRRHSFVLVVQPDGTATADWRTYRWCGSGSLPPCDALVGRRIVPGGHASLILDTGGTDASAGRVLESTDPAIAPGTPVRLQVPAAGSLRLALGGAGQEVLWAELCGPHAESVARCGA